MKEQRAESSLRLDALICGILAVPAIASILLAPEWANGDLVGAVYFAIAIVGLNGGLQAIVKDKQRGWVFLSTAACAVLFGALIWLTYVTYR